MNVQTKYDIGQEVYAVFYGEHQVQCPVCKGAALTLVSDVLFKCVNCDGTGTVNEFGKMLKPLKIRCIKVRVDTKGSVAQYGLWDEGDGGWLWLEEGQLYPTAEAAVRSGI